MCALLDEIKAFTLCNNENTYLEYPALHGKVPKKPQKT